MSERFRAPKRQIIRQKVFQQNFLKSFCIKIILSNSQISPLLVSQPPVGEISLFFVPKVRKVTASHLFPHL